MKFSTFEYLQKNRFNGTNYFSLGFSNLPNSSTLFKFEPWILLNLNVDKRVSRLALVYLVSNSKETKTYLCLYQDKILFWENKKSKLYLHISKCNSRIQKISKGCIFKIYNVDKTKLLYPGLNYGKIRLHQKLWLNPISKELDIKSLWKWTSSTISNTIELKHFHSNKYVVQSNRKSRSSSEDEESNNSDQSNGESFVLFLNWINILLENNFDIELSDSSQNKLKFAIWYQKSCNSINQEDVISIETLPNFNNRAEEKNKNEQYKSHSFRFREDSLIVELVDEI